MKVTPTAGLKTKCPACRKDVTVPVTCPRCGVQITPAEFARITSMQENLRNARANDTYYTVVAVAGAVIAVGIPFMTRYILHYLLDTFAWVLTGGGVMMLLAGSAGIWFSDRKVRKLTRELEGSASGQEKH